MKTIEQWLETSNNLPELFVSALRNHYAGTPIMSQPTCSLKTAIGQLMLEDRSVMENSIVSQVLRMLYDTYFVRIENLQPYSTVYGLTRGSKKRFAIRKFEYRQANRKELFCTTRGDAELLKKYSNGGR